MGVAGDDVDQATPGVGIESRRLGGFAHELQCRFKLGGVGVQALLVEGVAEGQVVAQQVSGPLAKLHALGRLDAVANGDDDVEVVEANRFVRPGYVQILHIAFFVQLTLFEHIADVFGDDRALTAKKLGHLLLRQPDGAPVQPHIDGTALALVDGDLVHVGPPLHCYDLCLNCGE